ncbi:amino acid adenylation domain-containing protein [Pseudoalteromonas sp. MMG013]|uniref:non-ribosomal peptide synthetase n=1 Tax=Pseudoalteromonas sp. MMG013 TaxID=2822687 RepID=UPI001B36C490|nr:non-ribosomal peptide synthetase [Pseudoalteromonas sp. MMG013]MBQ4862189.1 amino acid adenylation domain-containing protein [Pseudoalteromonas sp. MMG013]
MITILDIIKQAKSQGVLLYVEDGKLGFKLISKTFPADLKALIQTHKEEIIAVLSGDSDLTKSIKRTQTIPSRLHKDQPVPASAAQCRIWTAHNLAQNSHVYNMCKVLTLKGYLKLDILEKTLEHIFNRHNTLRSLFKVVSGELQQYVCNDNGPQLEVIEKLDMTSSRIKELIVEHANHRFDLEQGPLFKVHIYQTDAQQWVLIFTTHHILFDALSFDILTKELNTCYNAYLHGRSPELTPLQIDYLDYALWLKQQSNVESQQVFWQEQLRDASKVHKLPLDRQRPQLQSGDAKRINKVLALTTSEQIRKWVKGQNTTTFSFFHTALSVLVGRWSNSQDVVIGTAVSGRQHHQVGGVLGLFINMLAIRCQFDPAQTFTALLAQQKSRIEAILGQRGYPFESVLEALRLKRSSQFSPLFQILFSMQNKDERLIDLEGVQTEVHPVNTSQTRFDLEFSVSDYHGQYYLSCNYATDIFNRGTIERLLESYVSLLQDAISVDSLKVANLSILPKYDLESIAKLNNTTKDYEKHLCVHELFERQVVKTPNDIAAAFNGKLLTYSELDGKANKLAYTLYSSGIAAGEIVPIVMERGLEVLVSYLAVMKTGAAFSPLDPNTPASRLEAMLANLKTKVLLSQTSLSLSHIKLCAQRINVDINALDERAALGISVSSESPIYVIHTSGTTGLPKGAVNSHKGIVNRLSYMEQTFKFVEKERVLQTTHHCLDSSIWQFFWPLMHGGCCVLPEFKNGLDVSEIISLLLEYHISCTDFTPSTLSLLLDYLALNPSLSARLEHLKTLIVGGEASGLMLVQNCRKHLPNIQYYNAYGQTETSIGVIFKRIPEAINGVVPIGKPMQNVQAFVLDEAKQLLPVGVAGQLYIAGDCLGLGYFNNSEQTAQAFVKICYQGAIIQAYKTGDLARINEFAEIEYLGRVDKQIKVNGFRIELEDIEQVLNRCKKVSIAAVKSFENGGSHSIVGFILANDNEPSLKEDVLHHCVEHLPAYMVPNRIELLHTMPVSSSGKIDYGALKLSELEQKVVKATTVLEKELVHIWSTVLSLDESTLSISADFFESGGSSVQALKLAHYIEAQCGVRLSLKQLFEASTIQQQACKISNASKVDVNRIIARPFAKKVMSSAQRRLWFIDKLGGSPQYNITMLLKLEGQLDKVALEFALKEIVNRHVILRTNFVDKQEDAQLITQSCDGFSLTQSALHHVPEQEQQMMAIARQEAAYQFNLESDYLLRAHLIVMNERASMLILNIHHIAFDGWSQGVITSEFRALYNGFLEGHKTPLSDLEISYFDYAYWQQQILSDERGEALKSYWLQRLCGAPQVLELPQDRPRTKQTGNAAASCVKEIAPELYTRLQAFCYEHKMTMFNLTQGAFSLLLSRLSGQDDVVVGSPIAGRPIRQLEGLIGLFTNTLALRTQFNQHESCLTFLQRNKKNVLEDISNELMPFDSLVELLNPARNPLHSPIFQVMFAINNFEKSELSLKGLTVNRLQLNSQFSKFDLSVTVRDSSNMMSFDFMYNKGLFEEKTIQRIMTQFVNTLVSIIEKPHQSIAQVDLDSGELITRIKQLSLGAQSQLKHDTIMWHFDNQLRHKPDSIALVHGEDSYTYKELAVKVEQLAAGLQASGITQNTVVALHLRRSPLWLISILAVWRVGAAYVPIDSNLPMQRVEFMFSDVKPNLVISDNKAFLPKAVHIAIYSTEELIQRGDSVVLTEYHTQPHDLAYIIYTSGSTGNPKGVCVEHKALANLGQSLRDQLLLSYADLSRWGWNATYCFDASLQAISQVAFGSALVLVPEHLRQEPTLLIKYLNTHQVSIVDSTPTQLKQWFDSGISEQLPSLVIGGEAINMDVWKQLQSWSERTHKAAVNVYGPTEACVDATLVQITEDIDMPVIGKYLPNVQGFVLNGERLAPMGAVGELCIAGTGLARGYLNRSEQTEKQFVDVSLFGETKRIYRTGDLVRYDNDGQLRYLGRMDGQVKLRGYRIELGEIQTQIISVETVKDAAVTLFEHPQQGPMLIAYVVSNTSELPVDEHQKVINELIAKSLPEYMLPSHYEWLEKLPINASGKVNIKVLPEPNLSLCTNIKPAQTSQQQDMCDIWTGLLGVITLGIDNNFFELGGHSLLVTRLVNRIREHYKTELTVRDVFENPTIESLCARIETLAPHISVYDDELEFEDEEF